MWPSCLQSHRSCCFQRFWQAGWGSLSQGEGHQAGRGGSRGGGDGRQGSRFQFVSIPAKNKGCWLGKISLTTFYCIKSGNIYTFKTIDFFLFIIILLLFIVSVFVCCLSLTNNCTFANVIFLIHFNNLFSLCCPWLIKWETDCVSVWQMNHWTEAITWAGQSEQRTDVTSFHWNACVSNSGT